MIKVRFSQEFRKKMKKLSKKYHSLSKDLTPYIEQLQNGQLLGNQIQGAVLPTYKFRVSSSDMKRGKSGGYRVIYFVETEDGIVLLLFYTKSEFSDISVSELNRLIGKYID